MCPTGCRFLGWGDGSTASPCTDTNVTADVDATADFELLARVQYSFALGVGSAGAAVVSIDTPPASEYRFPNWIRGVLDPDSASARATVVGSKAVIAYVVEAATAPTEVRSYLPLLVRQPVQGAPE